MDQDRLNEHREQLRKYWSEGSVRMQRTLDVPSFGRLFEDDGKPIELRQLHNRFGWQSGARTHCAGAFYRTENFMNTAEPCAVKAEGQNIHIEHTVTISELMQAIPEMPRRNRQEFLIHLLGLSVTTGVTDGLDGERKTMVRPGMATRSRVLDRNHVSQNRPFCRYDPKKHSPIWDLVTGKKVDAETFNLGQHRANLKVALGWSGLDDWIRFLAA